MPTADDAGLATELEGLVVEGGDPVCLLLREDWWSIRGSL
jgi:hypothetical protein